MSVRRVGWAVTLLAVVPPEATVRTAVVPLVKTTLELSEKIERLCTVTLPGPPVALKVTVSPISKSSGLLEVCPVPVVVVPELL